MIRVGLIGCTSKKKKYPCKVQRFVNTLHTYSSKWKWKERADAYDDYLRQLHFKEKERIVREWESEQMEISKQRSNYHTDTLQKIRSAPESEVGFQKYLNGVKKIC